MRGGNPGIEAVYVFTHDSIFVGEDGPTHQPIEHAAALRLIPNLRVYRPADGFETVLARGMALKRTDGATALFLIRQKLPPILRETAGEAAVPLRALLLASPARGPDNGAMSTPNRERLAERLGGFLEGRAEVLEAYLFGSEARGDAQPHSDVDVAVYVDKARLPAAPFGYAAELTTALIALLGENRVDVVVLNDAGPLLYHRVLRDGVRVMSRDLAASTTREARAFSRYCDFVPHLRKIEQVLSDRWSRGASSR